MMPMSMPIRMSGAALNSTNGRWYYDWYDDYTPYHPRPQYDYGLHHRIGRAVKNESNYKQFTMCVQLLQLLSLLSPLGCDIAGCYKPMVGVVSSAAGDVKV